jgi:alkylation response protein AidB-like acyl-CoA dehydrogenase
MNTQAKGGISGAPTLNFDIPAEIVQRRHEFREVLDAEIRGPGIERDPKGPLSLEELQHFYGILQQTDIMRASLPEEVGGTNRSFLERVILAQEFVRAWPSLAVTVDSHNIVVEILARQGAPWMIERYVPGGISGDLIMGDMMSEPEAGSDTRNLKTRAVLRDGHYVVNGTKMWTTNGVWAHVAILTAVVDEDAYRRKPSEGVVHLLMDKSRVDWEVSDLPIIGLKAGTTGKIHFFDARVPEEFLFHDAGEGYRENLIVRGWARLLLAAWSVGLMEAAIEDATAFAKERITFGKSIAEHQMIQDLIVQMHVDLETSRLLTYKAASLMDRGERCDYEQCLAKLHTTEAVQRVTANAIQILGGRGLTTEEGFLTERHYRDARFLTIAEGTSQIMKLIVGRKALGVSAI